MTSYILILVLIDMHFKDSLNFQMLLDAGADPNTETPGCGGGSPPPPPACAPWTAVAGWTALVYACARGAVQTAQLLLARGGKVEGGATLHEDRTTLTPLQVRCHTTYTN